MVEGARPTQIARAPLNIALRHVGRILGDLDQSEADVRVVLAYCKHGQMRGDVPRLAIPIWPNENIRVTMGKVGRNLAWS